MIHSEGLTRTGHTLYKASVRFLESLVSKSMSSTLQSIKIKI